jgi:glycosyltransferase involved in cell wall biosynthesis
VVPSENDPWALVVNEGAASSLPLIVSRGCGAAATLVEEGANGWTFVPGDVRELASLLTRMASLADVRRREMGQRSCEIAAGWSTNRFVDGVLAALQVTRRPPAGPIADVLTRAWKGRVSVN